MKQKQIHSRRAFFRVAGGAIVGAGLAGQLLPETLAASSRRLRVACRDVHLKSTGAIDCWAAAHQLGVAGLEVDVNDKLECPGLYHPDKKYSVDGRDSIKNLKRDLRANKLVITAFCVHNRLDERLEEEVATMKRLATAAKELGVPVIRIDVVPRAVAREQFLPFAIEACKRVCNAVSHTQVKLGIENHGNTTNDPEFLEKLFAGVNSSRLGLTLDACNFYWYGHPLDEVYKICERFASRAFHTHCKNINYPEDQRNRRRAMGWEYGRYTSPVDRGDIDFRRIATILRRANYRGDLCLENECLGRFPKDQHPVILAREIAFLRSI